MKRPKSQMDIEGLSVSKGTLLVRLSWKSLSPKKEQKLLSDMRQVTLSTATFDLKRVGPGKAVVVFRGMHFRISGVSESKALLKEFISKANQILNFRSSWS